VEKETTEERVVAAGIPKSWACIDCGVNTAPGCMNAEQVAQAFAGGRGTKQTLDERCEVYTVKSAVWKAAGMKPDSGCLCIRCLETRLGRRLKPLDFDRKNRLNRLPGTDRLLSRRMGLVAWWKNK
jgi:hypothetical protein